MNTIRALLVTIMLCGSAGAVELVPCFVPGEDCAGLIVGEIAGARAELLVQAYEFSSAPILRAIAQAKQRGVDVLIILDSRNETRRHSGAPILAKEISILTDDTVKSAHNKVIVIDRKTVITGSFNFTFSAQHKNAENVLVVRDEPKLAEAYAANFERRARRRS